MLQRPLWDCQGLERQPEAREEEKEPRGWSVSEPGRGCPRRRGFPAVFRLNAGGKWPPVLGSGHRCWQCRKPPVLKWGLQCRGWGTGELLGALRREGKREVGRGECRQPPGGVVLSGEGEKWGGTELGREGLFLFLFEWRGSSMSGAVMVAVPQQGAILVSGLKQVRGWKS